MSQNAINPLGVGIVGFGRIGLEHARWIVAAGGRVVCVCDATEARRARAAGSGHAVTDDLDALLRRDDVQAVLIATPTSMHFDHASSALSAGKHVMVEKPVALDLPQARRLADEAAERGLMLSVFHNRRWDRDFLTVKSAVASGLFGKLISVESRLGQFASCVGPAAREYRPNWRNELAFGGGGLFDWGSHFVDQLWRLMRPARPLRLFAQLRGNLWSSDCDDFARLCIDFDDGSVGLVEINTTTARPLPRWHLDGTLGSADSPHSPEFDVERWSRLTFTSPDGSTRPIEPVAPGLDEPGLWRRFFDACAGVGAPAVPIGSVLPTMALLDAARTSSQSGNVIQIADFDAAE